MRGVLLVLWAAAALAAPLSAEQPGQAGATLPPAAVAEGRRLFQQKCALCHVSAVKSEPPYGPKLSREQVNRSEDGVKAIVRGGVGRMPGFQYTLEPSQVDAIVAFLKTLESPPERILTVTANP